MRDVQRRDGRRGKRHRTARKSPPQRDSRQAPNRRQHSGLAEKQRQHRCLRRAQGPEHSYLLAPRDDGGRDGVVDEEQAHQQRDVGQGGQVELERRQHLLDLLASPCRALHVEPGRQPRADGLFRFVEPRGLVQTHIDTVDSTQPVKRPLGRGDVHQDEVAVEGPCGPLVTQQRANAERPYTVAHCQVQRRTAAGIRPVGRRGGQPVPARKDFGDDHRRGVEEEFEKRLCSGLMVAGADVEPVLANRLVAQHVHAEHAHRLGASRRQDRHRVAFNHRADVAPGPQPRQLRQSRLVDTEARADDFKRRLARHGVESGGESAKCAGVGQAYGQHDRDAQRDPCHSQPGAQSLLRDTPQYEPAEDRH